MKVTDIIALARAGYKLADIKQLEAQEKDLEDKQKEEPKEEPEEKEKPIPMDEDEKEEPADSTDYKAEYEKLLKEVQNNNSNIDMSAKDNSKTDEEQLADIVRSFM